MPLLFGWIPSVDCIKKNIAATMQFAPTLVRLPLRKHFKSCFPTCNVYHWIKEIIDDTFFGDTPPHNDGILDHDAGVSMAQLDSSRTEVYPMLLESNMPGTFEDLICLHGMPHIIFSDNSKVQCAKQILDLLHLYVGDQRLPNK
jgi:hypothetical protein